MPNGTTSTAASGGPLAQAWARLRSPAPPPAPDAQFLRIRRGVVALSILGVALAIAVVVQSSAADHEERLEDARSGAAATARTVEQHVAGLIDANGQYLFGLRTQIEASGGIDAMDPERFGQMLRAERLHDEATRRAFVVDAAGARYGPGPEAGEDASFNRQRPYFLGHLDDAGRGIRVDAPFASAGKGDWVMPLSVRLDRVDGTFAGVAVLSLDVDYLLRYFRSLGLDPKASIALVGSDGRFQVRDPGFAEAIGKRVARPDPPYRGEEGVLEAASPVDGVNRVIAYHRVGDYSLYAVVTVPRDDILDAWLRSSVLRGAIAGCAIGLIALFAVLLVARLDSERLAQVSLAQFQRAVDRAGDLLYWIAEDGRIVYVNETAVRRFDPQRARAPAHFALNDLEASHDPAAWARVWAGLRERGTARFEARHLAHDGTAYPVDLSASYLEVDAAGYAFLIGRELAPR